MTQFNPLPNSIPRAAYVHVPFCRHRCGYCNFTVVAGRDDLIGDFLTAIELEFSSLGQVREIDTLFLGGGTPTHLPLPQLRRLLETIRRWFRFAEGHEFTVEANPSDITQDAVSLLAEFGVNRLSLGVQSFDPVKLKFLDRDHDADTIMRGLDLARSRIPSLAIDLIFGVPGETAELWQRDLGRTLMLEPDHVSTYGLTIERGSGLWSRWRRGRVMPLDEDRERALFELGIDALAGAGYEHYEVSNFALSGHRCRHNEVYWAGLSYFAFGPGAARYVGGRREVNHRSTTTYMKRVLAGQSPVAESEVLSPEDRARETLVIGLRRMMGVNRTRFAGETGYEVEQLMGSHLPRFLAAGLLEWAGDDLRLTREGLCVSDSMWPYLLRA